MQYYSIIPPKQATKPAGARNETRYSMRPLMIGITSRQTEVYEQLACYEIHAYIDYFKAADPSVLCVILPLVNEADAAAFAETLDGLCISGGADVDPALYGEEKEELTEVYDPGFDTSDVLLYRAFVKADKPVFGICRGIQLINAAEGGDLIQDIPSLLESEHNQRKMDPPLSDKETAHTVRSAAGSRLQKLCGSEFRVNSYHHQAIRTPAPGFAVTAFSSDGVIEAIEKNRIFAVQWHPERMLDDPAMIALAGMFLEDCRSDENAL